MTYRCHSASCTPKRSIRLSPVNMGSNRWCGPAALSIITGHTTDCMAAILRDVWSRWHYREVRAIMGVPRDVMVMALRRLGYRVEHRVYFEGRGGRPRPTVARFLRERSDKDRNTLLVVNAHHHYFVVKGRKYCDNLSGESQWISAYPKRRGRVRAYLIITK